MPPRRVLLNVHIVEQSKDVKLVYFGACNVCSLVDNEGTVETARLSSEKSRSEDRRIDLVI